MTIPNFSLAEAGSAACREALDTVGAVRFPGFANADEVVALRDAWQALSDAWVAEDRKKVNGIPVKYGVRPDGARYVNRFAFASLHHPTFSTFVNDPRFEAIRALCGPDIRIGEREKDGLVINCYRNEEGSRYKQLGWHTDGLRDLFYGRLPGPMYNVGFYLDDSPEEKGALRLIPGSHLQGFWSMALRKPYFIDHRPDPAEVLLEAKAGDLTIHDGRLWHRVGRATVTGDASLRRTMYIPFLNGPYEPKDESSPTPFYHHFQRITG